MKKTILLLAFVFCTLLLSANTYVVTNGADAGAGSLRQAITDANASSGGDLITFSIPATDPSYDAGRKVWILTPATAYAYITGPFLIIDGTTQAINQGDSNTFGPEIFIDGQNTLANALVVAGPGNTIKGLTISRFTYGVLMTYASDCLVTECYIGTNETGTGAMGNQYGIGISNLNTANTISNCLISGNQQAGIALQTSGQLVVIGNKIGTDRTGTLAVPNYYGIAFDNGFNCTIGGINPSQRNVISGNSSSGIALNGNNSFGNVIKGNHIGTDLNGNSAIPNDFGIVLANARSNTIGGSTVAERNIICGSLSGGILLNGTGTNNNVIKGNYIGLNANGTLEIHNHVGVLLKSNANSNTIGGNTTGERNVISGNDEIGVYIEASDSNVVTNNYIGPDASGLNPIMIGDSMFQGNGIELNTVSQHNLVLNNVISGNRVYGFVFYGQVSNNDLIDNYIGTDATGNAPMKNATGICVDGASNHNNILYNVLSGNISYGIFIVTTGTYYNVVQGNLIGTNAAGTDTIPNDIGLILGGGARYNLIGGPDPMQRNIISGNRFDGIEIADNMTDFNIITNNYIGTDITGTQALPNLHGVGIATFPANNTLDNNLISGNLQMGVIIYENADSNVVINNIIGTDALGSPLPNGLTGVLIMEGASHNIIGGDTYGNVIAHNGNGGVVIIDSTSKYNTISGNSMYDNHQLSGIDLYPYGCTVNDAGDADNGPNDLVNYPIVQMVAYDSITGETAIWGTVDVPVYDSAVVEIFISQLDSLGCGEGMTYLGQNMVNSSMMWVLLTHDLQITDKITTTLTDKFGNTSEFSPSYQVIFSDGVEEIAAMSHGMAVSPNPFSDHLAISFSKELPEQLDILNLTGRVVYSFDMIQDPRIIWDPQPSVASGIYLVKARFSDGSNRLIRVVKE